MNQTIAALLSEYTSRREKRKKELKKEREDGKKERRNTMRESFP